MKKIIKTLLVLPGLAILLTSFTIMNSSDGILNDVSNAIRQGKAAEVAKHFGANVDLTLPGSEGTMSRAQAEVLLRNFFSTHGPAQVNTVHKTSGDGSFFAILSLQTKAGDEFRVTILLKKVSDNYLLHQIKFEAQ